MHNSKIAFLFFVLITQKSSVQLSWTALKTTGFLLFPSQLTGLELGLVLNKREHFGYELTFSRSCFKVQLNVIIFTDHQRKGKHCNCLPVSESVLVLIAQ